MNLRPFVVARYGVWAALGAAVISAWLGQRAGASLDFALMRSTFVFVIVTALALGAEAVLFMDFKPTERTRAAAPDEPRHDDTNE